MLFERACLRDCDLSISKILVAALHNTHKPGENRSDGTKHASRNKVMHHADYPVNTDSIYSHRFMHKNTRSVYIHTLKAHICSIRIRFTTHLKVCQ